MRVDARSFGSFWRLDAEGVNDARVRGILLDATLRVYREGEQRATPAHPAHCTLDLAARLTAEAHRDGGLDA